MEFPGLPEHSDISPAFIPIATEAAELCQEGWKEAQRLRQIGSSARVHTPEPRVPTPSHRSGVSLETHNGFLGICSIEVNESIPVLR